MNKHFYHQQQYGEQSEKDHVLNCLPIAHAQMEWAWLHCPSDQRTISSNRWMAFSDLPDELILKIFGYLAHPELVNCLRVCQKWHRLANDDFLWYEVEISSYRLPSINGGSVLSAVARQHPNVHTLVVDINPDFWDSKLALKEIQQSSSVWTSFKNLSKLSVYDSPGKDFAVPLLHALPAILNTCYRTLTCFSCEGSTALESEQFQLIFSNPYIRYRELSIAHCPRVGDLAVYQAQFNSYFLKCLEDLEALNLDGVGTAWWRLSDAGIVAILSACPRLKSLYCDGESMTDESSKHIQKLTNLEHLSISFCSGLTDKSLECFSKLKNLTSLYLKRGDEFTNQGFENFFDGLCLSANGSPHHSGHFRNIGQLRKVCLIECKLLRDSGLMKLARNFPHLIHLDLSWCWNLSDIGLEAIARNCNRIETMKLVGLKNAMCVPVLRVSLPRLRVLDLQQTDLVDDEELRRLKEAKPWVKITNYYGDPVVQSGSSETSDSDSI